MQGKVIGLTASGEEVYDINTIFTQKQIEFVDRACSDQWSGKRVLFVIKDEGCNNKQVVSLLNSRSSMILNREFYQGGTSNINSHGGDLFNLNPDVVYVWEDLTRTEQEVIYTGNVYDWPVGMYRNLINKDQRYYVVYNEAGEKRVIFNDHILKNHVYKEPTFVYDPFEKFGDL